MKKEKDFKTRKEFFKYLIENKSEILTLKKSIIKCSDPIIVYKSAITKSLTTSNIDDIEKGIIKRTIIGNTYMWRDSHKDVHLNYLFEKSIKENGEKIFHLHDHEQKITAKVGKFTGIYEKAVAWKDLGIDIPGKTISLFGDSNIFRSYNPQVFDLYLNGEIDQHSVKMQYVQIDMAINDSEYKQEYILYKKHIDAIGNKEEVEEDGYFFAVGEAKLFEMSAVLQGSNELTPTLPNEEEKSDVSKKISGVKSFYSILAS